MSVAAKVYTWASGTYPGPMALNELDWEMYELPPVGAHYWHDRMGFTVAEVDESQEPPVVHLVHDPEWEEELHRGLPDGYLLDGGRREDDGTWRFRVLTPQGRPVGHTFSEDRDEAIGRAIDSAVEHFERTRSAGS